MSGKRSGGSDRVKQRKLRGISREKFEKWFLREYSRKMNREQHQIFCAAFNAGYQAKKRAAL